MLNLPEDYFQLSNWKKKSLNDARMSLSLSIPSFLWKITCDIGVRLKLLKLSLGKKKWSLVSVEMQNMSIERKCCGRAIGFSAWMLKSCLFTVTQQAANWLSVIFFLNSSMCFISSLWLCIPVFFHLSSKL